jgi:hypothetical protein
MYKGEQTALTRQDALLLMMKPNDKPFSNKVNDEYCEK